MLDHVRKALTSVNIQRALIKGAKEENSNIYYAHSEGTEEEETD